MISSQILTLIWISSVDDNTVAQTGQKSVSHYSSPQESSPRQGWQSYIINKLVPLAYSLISLTVYPSPPKTAARILPIPTTQDGEREQKREEQYTQFFFFQIFLESATQSFFLYLTGQKFHHGPTPNCKYQHGKIKMLSLKRKGNRY